MTPHVNERPESDLGNWKPTSNLAIALTGALGAAVSLLAAFGLAVLA
jgi:hypothetical protein